MMAAEEHLNVFPGAKRSGNTPAVLPQRATPENAQMLTAPRGCGDNGAGGCVGFALCLPGRCFASVMVARMGMRAQYEPLELLCVLQSEVFLPQQPQCDLISVSLNFPILHLFQLPLRTFLIRPLYVLFLCLLIGGKTEAADTVPDSRAKHSFAIGEKDFLLELTFEKNGSERRDGARLLHYPGYYVIFCRSAVPPSR